MEDILIKVLSAAVTVLGFALLYLFNQTQSLNKRCAENEKAIALNDAHDQRTDGTLNELKEMIMRLGEKIDTLLLQK